MQSVGIVVLEMVFPSHMSDCRPAYSNAVGRLRGWISLILDHEGVLNNWGSHTTFIVPELGRFRQPHLWVGMFNSWHTRT